MKFGVNKNIATKVGNFILSVVLIAVIILAACVMIKSSNDKSTEQTSYMQIRPSNAR